MLHHGVTENAETHGDHGLPTPALAGVVEVGRGAMQAHYEGTPKGLHRAASHLHTAQSAVGRLAFFLRVSPWSPPSVMKRQAAS